MANAKKLLKVRVTVEVEVDRDGYLAEYGEYSTAERIREQVRFEVKDAVIAAFQHLPSVTVR